MMASGRQTDLDRLQERALKIKSLYDDLNQAQRGRTWTREEFMLGFTGDVGDLASSSWRRKVHGTCRAAGKPSVTTWPIAFGPFSSLQTPTTSIWSQSSTER